MRGTMAILRAVPSSLWWGAGVALGFYLALCAIRAQLERPTVYRSWDTKECVRAETFDGKPLDCSTVGDKYYNVWVY